MRSFAQLFSCLLYRNSWPSSSKNLSGCSLRKLSQSPTQLRLRANWLPNDASLNNSRQHESMPRGGMQPHGGTTLQRSVA